MWPPEQSEQCSVLVQQPRRVPRIEVAVGYLTAQNAGGLLCEVALVYNVQADRYQRQFHQKASQDCANSDGGLSRQPRAGTPSSGLQSRAAVLFRV